MDEIEKLLATAERLAHLAKDLYEQNVTGDYTGVAQLSQAFSQLVIAKTAFLESL